MNRFTNFIRSEWVCVYELMWKDALNMDIKNYFKISFLCISFLQNKVQWASIVAYGHFKKAMSI